MMRQHPASMTQHHDEVDLGGFDRIDGKKSCCTATNRRRAPPTPPLLCALGVATHEICRRAPIFARVPGRLGAADVSRGADYAGCGGDGGPGPAGLPPRKARRAPVPLSRQPNTNIPSFSGCQTRPNTSFFPPSPFSTHRVLSESQRVPRTKESLILFLHPPPSLFSAPAGPPQNPTPRCSAWPCALPCSWSSPSARRRAAKWSDGASR